MTPSIISKLQTIKFFNLSTSNFHRTAKKSILSCEKHQIPAVQLNSLKGGTDETDILIEDILADRDENGGD